MDTDVKLDLLEEIGEISPHGIVIYNVSDQRVTYANAAALRLAGVTEPEILGSIQSLLNLVLPEDHEYLKSCIAQLPAQGRLIDIEFQMRGKEITQLTCNAFLVADGAFGVIFVRDVTKVREHELYLVEFGAKKNTLLDTLTHHLSGALNLMRNLTSHAEKSSTSSDQKDLQTYFSLINENNKYCLEIINNLWSEEHIESTNTVVKKTRVDVVRVINFIFQELTQSFRHRNFVLKNSAPSIIINADEVKLLQIVNNLTSNAIKFTPHQNEIKIEVREMEDDVIIMVSDQGIGIPENLKKYIFDRYGNAGRTGLNGEKSKGLGLSICRNLTTLMNGDIWFESEEGKGSAFYLRLPKGSEGPDVSKS